MFRDFRFSLPLLAAAAWACSGGQTGSASSLAIKPTPASVPADGLTAITLLITAVGTDGNPYNGNVSLTSNKQVVYGDGMVEDDTVVVTKGAALQTITCAPGTDCVGTFIINCSLSSNGANASSQTQVTFTGLPPNPDAGDAGDAGEESDAGDGGEMMDKDAGPPADAGPGLVKFVSQSNPYMGINYGTNYVKYPTDSLKFEVTDSTGMIPIPGVPVFVVITSSAPGVGYLVGAFDGGADGESISAISAADGTFPVKTQSGQKAGTVTVIATVAGLDGGTDISGSEQVSVIGTQPSAAKSTLSCSPANLPVYAQGISGLPCETTAAGTPLATTCTVNLADRFGQVVEIPITVQFFSEAGNFTSASATTPDFMAPGTSGQAQTTLQTTSNVPEDVDPLPTIEPYYTDIDPPPSERCGNRTYNPRDGLVTVIAVFTGEEQYTDLNASGIYEPGDPFTDLPQPFVDSNDNSKYDPGEICPGSSVANSCAGPDGVWDANSTLYVETRILYSGVGVGLPTSVAPQGSTITFSDPGPGQLEIPEQGAVVGNVTWADANLNVGAVINASASYNVVVSTGPQSVSCSFPAPGAKALPADSLGMSVTSLTECSPGMVPGDGGEVSSMICSLVTQVSQFSGGFTTGYKCTNSNTQAGGGGPITLSAPQQILADFSSNTLSGMSE